MKAVAILNCNKGDPDDVASALANAGVEAKVETVEGSAIRERAEAAVKAGARLIIVGGGDGSVSSAAQAVAGTEATLGILPLGTLNHMARDLGIPLDLQDAAKLVGSGKSRAVDVAEVNG